MVMRRRIKDAVGTNLRLRAEDAEDLAVLAACLQDAVARRADMAFRPKQRRFALLFNRYRWEQEGGQRIRCGVHFDTVQKVSRQGFDGLGPEAVLSLLTLLHEPAGMDKEILTLVFAGGPMVRLETECIDVSLDDIGDPWITPRHPDHDSSSSAEGQS